MTRLVDLLVLLREEYLRSRVRYLAKRGQLSQEIGERNARIALVDLDPNLVRVTPGGNPAPDRYRYACKWVTKRITNVLAQAEHESEGITDKLDVDVDFLLGDDLPPEVHPALDRAITADDPDPETIDGRIIAALKQFDTDGRTDELLCLLRRDYPDEPLPLVVGAEATEIKQLDAPKISQDRDDDHQPNNNVFNQDGKIWTIVFQGEKHQLVHSMGLSYIQCLLSSPSRKIHVTELDKIGNKAPTSSTTKQINTMEDGLSIKTPSDTGAILDLEAKRGYEKKIAQIEEGIREAEKEGDTTLRDIQRSELSEIVQELKNAKGFGGRDRKSGDDLKKVTDRVSSRIRDALKNIKELHEPCWRHLKPSIQLGEFCSYSPEYNISWII